MSINAPISVLGKCTTHMMPLRCCPLVIADWLAELLPRTETWPDIVVLERVGWVRCRVGKGDTRLGTHPDSGASARTAPRPKDGRIMCHLPRHRTVRNKPLGAALLAETTLQAFGHHMVHATDPILSNLAAASIHGLAVVAASDLVRPRVPRCSKLFKI